MAEDEKDKERTYLVWKLIASYGLFPQNLQAFARISKMHWEILRECASSGCFWTKLRRNATLFAEAEFDDQEWINFQTLRRSPITQMPTSRFSSTTATSSAISTTVDDISARNPRPNRSNKPIVSEGGFGGGTMRREHRRGKRSPQVDCNVVLNTDNTREVSGSGDGEMEYITRRFMRLCYFPVLWMHEYKRVVLMMNVPQKFQETEEQLKKRMEEMVLKYGRLNLQRCSFHTSVHDLVWSVESGRKKRALSRRYFIPGSPAKDTQMKLPWYKYQTVIAVCDSEDDVEMLMARKGRFRKEASVYLTRCASSGDLDRLLIKGTEKMTEEIIKEEYL